MIMTKEYNKLDKTFNLTPDVEECDTPEGGCATRKDQLTDVTPGGLKKPDRLTQTDVEKDGTLSDPDFSLLKYLFNKTGNKTIVAGGISKIDHIKKLKDYGIENIVIGKAIYEGQIDLKEALENV